MKHHYSMTIQWSEEDGCFLVTLPEFADLLVQPATHGDTYEEAVKHGQEMIETMVEL